MAKRCHSKTTGRFVNCKRQAAAKARCRSNGKFSNCLAGAMAGPISEMLPPPLRPWKGDFLGKVGQAISPEQYDMIPADLYGEGGGGKVPPPLPFGMKPPKY